MTKFCIKCGNPIPDGINFCSKCGKTIGQGSVEPFTELPQPSQQPNYQQQPPQTHPYQQTTLAQPQPNYGQTQPYIPPPTPKKSNKKVIIGAIVIVIIIILAGLLVFFFVSGNDEGKFIGTWRLESITGVINGETSTQAGNGTTITFNSDKTFTMTYPSYYIDDQYQPYSETGTWELKDGKLCVGASSSSVNSSAVCYTYEFSDNNKRLTLNERYSSTDFTREMTLVFIKI